MKRTGGATLATMVTWHISAQKSSGEENGEVGKSADKWGMICTAPSFEDSTVDWISLPAIAVAQRAVPDNTYGPVEYFFIRVMITSNKFSDSRFTKPYNQCGVNYTATISIDGSDNPHVDYFGDYIVSCAEATGFIWWSQTYSNWEGNEMNIPVYGIGGFPVAGVNVNIRKGSGIPLGFFIKVTYLSPLRGPYFGAPPAPVLFEQFVSSPTIFVEKKK